ncbi:MAG: DUF4384 domain-containing protein [Alphaproteobacteria bacterium]|nr:DUF4384 domain-containing protein [Alphaproteobacteria bacterium]
MTLFPMEARGEWMQGEGEYNFSPALSENEACKRADRRAKEAAMRVVSGERLSSEDLQVCTEMQDTAECSLNRFTWSTINGVIKGIRNKKAETIPGISGYRKCRVSLEVDVRVGSGQPDPGFDMTVRLNHGIYRNGESLKIDIDPTQPMYINVFQWLPYKKTDLQVQHIFPNEFDEQGHFQEPNSIPTREGGSRYDLKVSFPDDLKGEKELVDEYLMVIGTREPVTFRKTYSLEEFNSRLLEISRRDRRTIRKAYNVVRPE